MARYDDEDDIDDRPAPRRRRPDDEEDERDAGRGRRRHQDDEGEYDFRKRDFPHSGVGIASCLLAVLAVVTAGFGMVLAFAVGLDELDAAIEAEEPKAMAVGLMMIGAVLIALIGGVLGAAGLAQRDRNKLFAAIGLCANGLLFLCGLALMIIGSLMD